MRNYLIQIQGVRQAASKGLISQGTARTLIDYLEELAREKAAKTVVHRKNPPYPHLAAPIRKMQDAGLTDAQIATHLVRYLDFEPHEAKRLVHTYTVAPGRHSSGKGPYSRRVSVASIVDPREIAMGVEHEMEHTTSRRVARMIALDHLREHPKYYSTLKRVFSRGKL